MKHPIELLIVVLCLFPFLSVPAQAWVGADRIEKPIRDGLSFLGHNGQNGAHLMDVEISGDRLYVFSRDKGFRIYDISGPIPVLLGEYDPVDPNTLYENGVLKGQTFYVAAHQKGLDVFDVSNPASPVLLNNVPLAENACWDVETAGAFLFVANGRFGLSVVDLTSPPAEAASLPLPGLANHILLDVGTAVLSLGPEGIGTVDVTIPVFPRLLDTARSRRNAFGSGLLDHKVVVGSWSFLEMFDVRDPENIKRTAWDDTKTWAMGADIKTYGNGGLHGIRRVVVTSLRVARCGVRWTGVLDTNGRVKSLYLAPNPEAPYPLDFIIDKEGRVRYWETAYDVQDLLVTIEELLAWKPTVTVDAIPDTTNVHPGGVLGYAVKVTNNTAKDQVFQAWAEEIQPDSLRLQLWGPIQVFLKDGDTKNVHLYESLPGAIPLGSYSLKVKVGPSQQEAWDVGSVDFMVS